MCQNKMTKSRDAITFTLNALERSCSLHYFIICVQYLNNLLLNSVLSLNCIFFF